MENLLFLVHRIPYPPNKGDKIRSYHFLKYLATEFNVHLGAFIDDPHDWQYTGELDALCASAHFQGLQPLAAKLKSLQGLLTGQALSLPYYQSQGLQAWVDATITAHGIRKVLVFSSVMGQFVKPHHKLDMVVDFVDVDSDKWRQYADKKQGVARWVYRREAERLLVYERQLAKRAQTNVFVSEQEAALFKKLAPELDGKITFVNNGVDTDYFSPGRSYPSPYPDNRDVLVFTGAMDYWANIDAVVWFAEQVFPLLQAEHPQLQFYIVGSKPSKAVLALADNPNIRVTGRVDDVRPYTAHARLVVAPLRIARGIQNKVLEAMAMGKPVVATTAAMEGIPCAQAEGLALAISDDALPMARQVALLLQSAMANMVAKANRDFVSAQFSWQQNARQLGALLQE